MQLQLAVRSAPRFVFFNHVVRWLVTCAVGWRGVCGSPGAGAGKFPPQTPNGAPAPAAGFGLAFSAISNPPWGDISGLG